MILSKVQSLSLLHRVDAADAEHAYPALQQGDDSYRLEGDFLARGEADPTFPYGRAPLGDGGTILGYRGPEGTYLKPGFYAVFEWDESDQMYAWWCTLEIVDGTPVLYVWAGQIAG